MPVTFDHNTWITELSGALTILIDGAEHPPHTPRKASWPTVECIDDARLDDLQRYKDLGALARTSPYASMLFSETRFPARDTPHWRAVSNLILDHPCFKRSWFDTSMNVDTGSAPFALLIQCLAALSVRRSSRHAATRLHRFLVLGRCNLLAAYEITLLHGLDVSERIALGGKAYLAPYDDVRRRFGLEEDPEHWLTRGTRSQPRSLSDDPTVCALVRRFSWGGKPQLDNEPGDSAYLRHWHPDDHRVDDVAATFDERALLVKLWSIVMETKLVSHTVIVHLPVWMRSLDPNLGFDRPISGSRLFDVWPRDRTPTSDDVQSYIAAANGWLSHYSRTRPFKLDLAIDRIVASYGAVSGDFGFADPIVDVSIALEAMYGPFKPRTIVESLSQRAGWVLGGTKGKRNKIARAVRRFYEDARSDVVHAANPLAYHERELSEELAAGRAIARDSVLAILQDDLLAQDVSEWDRRLSHGNRRKSHNPSRNSLS